MPTTLAAMVAHQQQQKAKLVTHPADRVLWLDTSLTLNNIRRR